MLFSGDRTQLRRCFSDAWHKQQAGQALEPLERLLAEVIARHPEYHTLLTDAGLERDFLAEGGEVNPFLHLGMHIAIQEQVSSDRPAGIMVVYRALCRRYGDLHEAEHRMMDCLGETLWEAQRAGVLPDEARYLQRLQRLLQ